MRTRPYRQRHAQLLLLVVAGLFLAGCASVVETEPVTRFDLPEPVDEATGERLDRSSADLLFLDTEGRYRLADSRWRQSGGADDPEAGAGRALAPAGVELVPRELGGPIALQGGAVWHPSGDAVAVTVQRGEGEERDHAILLVVPAAGVGEVIWEGRERGPFFLGWSPDGKRLAFLSSPVQGDGPLELDVLTFTGDIARASTRMASGEPLDAQIEQVSIATGSPVYFDWSAGGDGMVVNVAGSLFRVTFASAQAEFTIRALQLRPGRFQAPHVGSSGASFAAVVIIDGVQQIAVVDQSDATRVQARAPGGAALVWHPEGRYLAAIRYAGTSRLGILDIIDTEGSPVIASGDRARGIAIPASFSVEAQASTRVGGALAAQWTNDGETLLVLAPAPPGDGEARTLRFQWIAVRREGGEWQAEQLIPFRPSPTFLQSVLPFFDQYQRAATRLRPDGSAFAFGALDSVGQAGVFVYDLNERTVRQVAAGVIPQWRPRP